MKWRAAKSLIALRNQVNAKFPNRNKDWDGLVGDTRHASRKSDHNPWVDGGIVTAMDITHDPKRGVDSYEMAEELRQSRDPRIKYIISNRKIASSTNSPWKWRKYTGSNPHDHHVHISVKSERRFYDDEDAWDLPMLSRTREPEVAELEEGDDEESVSSHGGVMDTVESIADTADTVTTISAKAKPLFRSRISVAAATMGAGNVAIAASQAPPSLWEQFLDIWKSPVWWLVVLNLCLAGYIIWHYWRDHGYGAVNRRRDD